MSFFDSFTPLSSVPEPREHFEPPEWWGPPRGVLPGYSGQRAVVVRTDQVLMVVGPFSCYPAGVEYAINLWLREPSEIHPGPPWELFHPHGPKVDDDEFLRLGLRLADGSTWANVERRPLHPQTRPEPPVIHPRGGGGGGNHWRQGWWMWPLPPEGPVTFYAAWRLYHIDETSATIDATELRKRAAEAEVVWDD